MKGRNANPTKDQKGNATGKTTRVLTTLEREMYGYKIATDGSGKPAHVTANGDYHCIIPDEVAKQHRPGRNRHKNKKQFNNNSLGIISRDKRTFPSKSKDQKLKELKQKEKYDQEEQQELQQQTTAAETKQSAGGLMSTFLSTDLLVDTTKDENGHGVDSNGNIKLVGTVTVKGFVPDAKTKAALLANPDLDVPQITATGDGGFTYGAGKYNAVEIKAAPSLEEQSRETPQGK